MNPGSRGVFGCLALLGACALITFASISPWIGALMLVTACGATAAIATGRFPSVPRGRALWAGVVAALSLLGMISALARQRDQAASERAIAERIAAEAQATAERERHLADLRAHAPDLLAGARGSIDDARAAMDAGRFDDALTAADSATATLAELITLDPPVDGASAIGSDAAALHEDATACRSTQAAIERARAVTDPSADEDLIEWDDMMDTIASSFSLSLPVARARLHDQIEEAERTLSRMRARHSRDVAQAHRRATAAVTNAERRQREEFAARMDENFIHDGIEVDSVRATGTDGTTLRINYALCGRVFIDRIAGGPADQAAARALGFRRVECHSYFEHAYIDL